MPKSNGLERSIGRLEGKVDALITEVKDLKKSFNTLEEGRVSTLEHDFAKLYTEVKIKAKNTAMWMSAIISIGVSVLTAVLINRFS